MITVLLKMTVMTLVGLTMLFKLVVLYVVLFLTIYWHELGHLPKKIRIRQWFPLPAADALDSGTRYGGLLLNFLVCFAVFYFRPENILFLIFGLFNFLHLVLYVFLGSVMPEPGKVFVFTVQDDVPNKLWFLFIPAGIALLYWMGSFYLEAANIIFDWVVVS